MNACCYRLIVDKQRNALVPVAEFVKGCGKGAAAGAANAAKASGAFRQKFSGNLRALILALAGALISCGACGFDTTAAPANPLPTGGIVRIGAATMTTTGTVLTVRQTDPRSGIYWNTFDIDAGYTVKFIQPSASAVMLNRVTGADPSRILGSLQANGQIFLVNPNGILFGRDAQVNVGSLFATTRNVGEFAFLSSNFSFGGSSNAAVINQGNLRATEGGYIVLAGSNVDNSGAITAPNGTVALAAGGGVKLSFDANSKAQVNVSSAVLDALIENQGLLAADGGQVLLTARGRNMLQAEVMNLSGVMAARSIANTSGKIVIDAGNAADGGRVTLTDATLDASGGNGSLGGAIALNGQHIGIFGNTTVNASGALGGGTVLIGGDLQNKAQSLVNMALSNATFIDQNVAIDVSSSNGSGGFVETSGKALGMFGSVLGNASADKAGAQWLLDMANASITSASAALVNMSNAWNAAVASSFAINNRSIEAALNSGANITVTSAGIAAGPGAGNMSINASIQKTSGGSASLSFFSSGAMNFASGVNVTSTAGKLDMNFSAGGALNFNSNNLTTFGGNLSAWGAAMAANMGGIQFAGPGNRIDVGNGSALFTGNNNVSGGWGMALLNNANLSIGGNVSLFGNNTQASNKSWSFMQQGNNTISLDSGSNLTINGTSASGNGFYLNGGTYEGGGNLTMTSFAAEYTGPEFGAMYLVEMPEFDIEGDLSLTGEGGYRGINTAPGAGMNISAANVCISGTSAQDAGVFINGPFTQNVSGNSSITGTSNASHGLYFNGAVNSTVGGTANLTGRSNSSNSSRAATGLTLAGSNNLQGNHTLNGHSANGTGLCVTGPATTHDRGNLTLSGSSGNASRAAVNITSNLSYNGTLTLAVENQSEISGVLSGNGSLGKEGNGTLVLTGNNTYKGATTIKKGTLQVGNGSSAGSLGTGNITNDANLSYNYSKTAVVALPNASRYKGSGNLSAKAGNIKLTGNLAVAGKFSYNATNVSNIGGGMAGNITVTAGSADISGSIHAAADNNDTFKIDTSASNGTININNVTSGSANGSNFNNLEFNAGKGRVNISGSNQFNWVRIGAKLYYVGMIYGNGRMSAGRAVNGTTGSGNLNVTFNNSGNSTYAGAIDSPNINLIKEGSGTQILTGDNTLGATTVSCGTLQVGDNGVTGALGSGNVSNDGNLVINRADSVALSALIGNVSGTGNFTASVGGDLSIDRSIAQTGADSRIELIAGSEAQAGERNGNVSFAAGGAVTTSDTGTVTLMTGEANLAALDGCITGADSAGTRYATFNTSEVSSAAGARSYNVRAPATGNVSQLAAAKTYDGTADAADALDFSAATATAGGLTGSITELHARTATFNQSHVLGANGSLLSVSFDSALPLDVSSGGKHWSIAGVDVSNYSAQTGTITPRTLIINATADSKLFDGTAASNQTPVVTGAAPRDSVRLTQTFSSSKPGSVAVNAGPLTDAHISGGGWASDYKAIYNPASGLIKEVINKAATNKAALSEELKMQWLRQILPVSTINSAPPKTLAVTQVETVANSSPASNASLASNVSAASNTSVASSGSVTSNTNTARYGSVISNSLVASDGIAASHAVTKAVAVLAAAPKLGPPASVDLLGGSMLAAASVPIAAAPAPAADNLPPCPPPKGVAAASTRAIRPAAPLPLWTPYLAGRIGPWGQARPLIYAAQKSGGVLRRPRKPALPTCSTSTH